MYGFQTGIHFFFWILSEFKPRTTLGPNVKYAYKIFHNPKSRYSWELTEPYFYFDGHMDFLQDKLALQPLRL